MTKNISKNITFRTEIEFTGSIAEFEKAAKVLVDSPFRIRVEWPRGHTAGCWPIPIMEKPFKPIFDHLQRLKENTYLINTGIAGGIRDPHLHIKDGINIIERSDFQKFVGEIASKLVEEFAVNHDYVETVGVIRDMTQSIK